MGSEIAHWFRWLCFYYLVLVFANFLFQDSELGVLARAKCSGLSNS